MRAATCQACNRTFDSAHTRKLAGTIRAFVEKPPSTLANWERKIVTTHLIADPEITAGAAPLLSMRQNPAAAITELGEEMGEFVAKGPANFDLAVIG